MINSLLKSETLKNRHNGYMAEIIMNKSNGKDID